MRLFTITYALTRGTIGRADWECYFHHACVTALDQVSALAHCVEDTQPEFHFHALVSLDGHIAPIALASRDFFHAHHNFPKA